MSERAILTALRRKSPAIGDDCFLYRPRKGEELLFTTDLLIEGVHFRRETHGPRDIGYKALARGLSDLAAMGAVPRFCMLSLALPPDVDRRYIAQIFAGLRELDCPLVGGDLSSASLLLCDIVACGSVPKGTALLRSGARPGDAIYVSGSLGGSALGGRKHLRPEPRLALGQYLRRTKRATAAMDISDGLSLDLARLCEESGVSAEIDDIPIFPGATLDQALHWGEDYELLFSARADVPKHFVKLPLHRIGTIARGRPGFVRLEGNPLHALGWDHFRKR